jgi:hypothetical protein
LCHVERSETSQNVASAVKHNGPRFFASLRMTCLDERRQKTLAFFDTIAMSVVHLS